VKQLYAVTAMMEISKDGKAGKDPWPLRRLLVEGEMVVDNS
jgi:hypothetical protein